MLELISSAAVATVSALPEVCSEAEDICCEIAESSVEEEDSDSAFPAISSIIPWSFSINILKYFASSPISSRLLTSRRLVRSPSPCAISLRLSASFDIGFVVRTAKRKIITAARIVIITPAILLYFIISKRGPARNSASNALATIIQFLCSKNLNAAILYVLVLGERYLKYPFPLSSIFFICGFAAQFFPLAFLWISKSPLGFITKINPVFPMVICSLHIFLINAWSISGLASKKV